MASSNESLVCVTGATGYIASHIISQLQEQGYRVRGTVRSLENEEKLRTDLEALCPEAEHKIEIVEGDLTKAETWEAAVKDCTYVIHTASPLPATVPKDEKEVVEPAVEGTLSVLKACKAAKVKRVVLTSAVVAISGSVPSSDPEKVYNEEDWGDPEKADAYPKSKISAEKAAWDFIKELPDEEKFELAVINPAVALGPVLNGKISTSMEMLKRLLERSIPACPRLNLPVVDVRDVAAAHIKAMTEPEAAGNRHIVINQNIWLREIAQTLSKEFKPQGYGIPTAHCPYFAAWITALFDKNVKNLLPQIGKTMKYDNTRMKEKLGIEPRDINATLLEGCYSMIEKGLIKKPKPKKTKKAAADAEKDEEEGKAEDVKENGDVGDEKKEGDNNETEKKEGEDNKTEENEKKDDTKDEEKTEEKIEEVADK
ncbi:uncharacterized protein LOC141910679 [Tubulanus polymorphus]|uniref:uncharacterized protein LOC141910679 n=1 Tax=Tubulanus polymorphus TaxID=672921 RepID=UPI003DA3E132